MAAVLQPNSGGADMLSQEEYHAIVERAPCASGLPNRAYTDPAFFAWEKRHLFRNTWVAVANDCELPNAGDVKPMCFLDVPLVLVRNQAMEIRAFHNVCSHRGNELVWEQGNCGGRLRCPYHAWTYDLDGNLRGTPHVGGTGVHEVEGFSKSAYGLKTIPAVVWMGLVFINLSGNGPAFEEFIAPLQARVDALASPEQFAQLVPGETHSQVTIEFRGNWKLCLENNLEAYHLPWVHPDLNAISRLEDHYHYEHDGSFAGQGSTAYDHRRGFDPVFPEFSGWPTGISEYPTLYPNVMLGLHCDHFWTRYVEPIAPDRTLDHLRLFYLEEAATGARFSAMREKRLETWVQVFNEDISVVEGMQRGRQSEAFAGGVFTPVLDKPSLHFARWMASRLNTTA